MPPRLLIIADDLTGANDTGVQLAQQGVPTLVGLTADALCTDTPACQVFVVNTESRHLTPAAAYARIFEVVRQGLNLGIPHFYKKTDSTLRGNIGSELAALLDATNESALLYAPAYPKLQRTTEQGVQLLASVPIHQTSFARDRFNPVAESFIPALIGTQTTIAVKIFAGNDATTEPTIFVLDATTEADLLRHAQWVRTHATTKLLAGSAGWAAYLPEIFALQRDEISAPKISGPLLIVNGSLHENSLRQIEYARQQGVPVINLSDNAAVRSDCVAQLRAMLARGESAILSTTTQPAQTNVAAQLARYTSQVLQRVEIGALVVFGGDTLGAIAHHLAWELLRPRTEFCAGIPIVEVCAAKKMLLLTKAGGFGAESLLPDLLGQLTAREPQ